MQKGRHFTTPSVKELQSHVPQSADPDHRHTVGWLDTELDQRVEDGNAATEQRSGTLYIDILG